MPKHTVMVLGAGNANYYSIAEMAKMQDVNIILADGNKNTPCRDIANTKFLCLDISNTQRVMEAAESLKIDAICPMNDHAIRTSSYIATKLDLKGLSMASANAVLDKGCMREVWRAYGLPQPNFLVIKDEGEIKGFAKKYGFPLVLKPVDCGGGGRGVMVIENYENIGTAFKSASEYLKRNDRLIIEEFISGVETSVEIVKTQKGCEIIAFSDKYKPDIVSRVATRINYPGNFPAGTVDKIKAICESSFLALGIKEGIGHFELIIDGDSVQLVEMGARAGGGHTFHPIASHVSGINYPQWLIKFLLDIHEYPRVSQYKGAAYHFLHSHNRGTIREITGIEYAQKLKNIFCVETWKKNGDHVDGLQNSMERIGCVVSLADTRDMAYSSANNAINATNISVE